MERYVLNVRIACLKAPRCGTITSSKAPWADDKNLDDEVSEREELLWIKWVIKLPEDEKTLA